MQSPLLSISGNVPTFLPRDAMCKRGLCCRPVSVRLSVRHVGVLYPNGWRYRQTFSRPVSPMMIVFWSRAPIPNSQGQRSRSQGRGHIVAASRTACLIVHWSSTAVITKWRIMWQKWHRIICHFRTPEQNVARQKAPEDPNKNQPVWNIRYVSVLYGAEC